MVNRWAIYGAVSAILVVSAGLLITLWFDPQTTLGIWTGLASAWAVQAAAFAILLLAARRRAGLVVAGWTAGTVLRLAAVGVLAWLTLSEATTLPAAPTLLALVAGLFGLLLLEPVIFQRRRSEAR